jgi:hypothetical protein
MRAIHVLFATHCAGLSASSWWASCYVDHYVAEIHYRSEERNCGQRKTVCLTEMHCAQLSVGSLGYFLLTDSHDVAFQFSERASMQSVTDVSVICII